MGEPVGWIYEDDEGRMMFSQMPHPSPLWEPVYRAAPKRNFEFSTIDEAKQPMPTPAGRPQLTDDESRFADAFTALLKAGYGKEAEIILKCKPAWQGLTKTEVKVLWRASNNQAEFASLLEAKLKERNI